MSELRHPMPCPGCRKIIDASAHLCPYCGVDTDAKLAPLRAALPFVLVGLLLVAGASTRMLTPGVAIALCVGFVAAMVLASRRKR